jgi:RNA polymerase sigma-54 factor
MRLENRQSQQLVMTPQLQQSIKLLQMSSMELQEFVAEEMEKNPLLSSSEGEIGESDASEVTPTEEQQHDSQMEELKNYLGDWGDTPDYSGRSVRSDDDTSASDILERTMPDILSLRDHLLEQLALDVSDPEMRIIGVQLIGMLDDAGYLREDTSELSQLLLCLPEDIERTLEVLQRFEPAGVFARSLRECLWLQCREREMLTPEMEIVLDHLDLVAGHDWPKLARLCGVDKDSLQQMVAEIRSLDPKPGSHFGGHTVQTVVPDAIVRPYSEGGWFVELNAQALPRVLVNRHYFATVSSKTVNRDEKKYLTEQMSNARWLVKAMDQRARTILTVAREIVTQQEAFLRYGVKALKPMMLRDIAAKAGLHESTVSRVTTNKFLQTPRGVFEMKFFFTTAVGADDQRDGHSSAVIKQHIRELIEDEAPGEILSDDAIVDLLKTLKIQVARRTVAKYREAIGIAGSAERRRQKRG